MFNINFDHLIKANLPSERRITFWSKLLEWWLRYTNLTHQIANKQGQYYYQWATTTGQIGSLVETLNSQFEVDSIYITDVDWIDEVSVYLDGEPYDEVTLWLDSENIDLIADAEECFIYLDSETPAYQFIIWIPASLFTEEYVELITNYASAHVLAGKNFIINQIP